MFAVFTTTLVAGLVDGLNPIALAQQFVLQSKIKSPYHILSFILSNSLVNFLFGMVFYFGFSNWILLAFNWVNQCYPNIWRILALIASVLTVAYLVYSHFKKDKTSPSDESLQEVDQQNNEKYLSVKSLFLIGMATCAAELSSAAPYLALLGYFATAPVTGLDVTLLLVFYSFILYVLPLYALFLMSLFFKSRLSTIYTRIASLMDYFITHILPIILILIAIALFWYGIRVF